jgi:hypothetical protein
MKVGIDSNVLTYLTEVIDPSYDPVLDRSGLVHEKVAVLRIYLYAGQSYYVVPEVTREYKQITHVVKKSTHEGFSGNLLLDGGWVLDQTQVQRRKHQYLQHHSSHKDCQIVAESEVGNLDYLLTCDRILLTKLGLKTQSIRLVTPVDLWNSLGIKKGAHPKYSPHHTNPLSKKKWWIW